MPDLEAYERLVKKGICIIKDGPPTVDKGGIVHGADVSIYLKGLGANLVFAGGLRAVTTNADDGTA